MVCLIFIYVCCVYFHCEIYRLNRTSIVQNKCWVSLELAVFILCIWYGTPLQKTQSQYVNSRSLQIMLLGFYTIWEYLRWIQQKAILKSIGFGTRTQPWQILHTHGFINYLLLFLRTAVAHPLSLDLVQSHSSSNKLNKNNYVRKYAHVNIAKEIERKQKKKNKWIDIFRGNDCFCI